MSLPIINEEKELVVKDLFFNAELFQQAWEASKLLAASDFVPANFKQKPENCFIALETSTRLGVSPIMLMQRMYIIQGKPSIESQLAIALVNMSGRFTPLKFKFKDLGKIDIKGKKYDNFECVAYATEKESGETLESIPVSMQMACDEGWALKNGSKWLTLPRLMAQYRSGTFFARTYAPEALAGFLTKEEAEDIEPINIESTIEPDTSDANTGEVIDADFDQADFAQIENKEAAPENTGVLPEMDM